MSDIVYYVLCGALSLGVMAGIAMMSKVHTSVMGNLLSAACVAGAILLTLLRYGIFSFLELWICMVLALGCGLLWARRVNMIGMPQMVAVLNGLGGGASALVAAVSVLDGRGMNYFEITTAGIALVVGMLTLSGSLIAAGKLHKIIVQRPVTLPAHQFLTIASIIVAIAFTAQMLSSPGAPLAGVIGGALFGGLFGVLFSIRVGGADMPITISLLNSLSGVAGSIAGMAVGDPLLVAIGGIVGASGLLLTQIMCRAMNRRLSDILIGNAMSPPQKTPESEPDGEQILSAAPENAPPEKLKPEEILKAAKKVIIIPGYGMAVAQAQAYVKQLADKLEGMGAQVDFAIHPVAGRMPGHMNVLLAEVDVPYEKLREMDDINPEFGDSDVAVIIGANDVVNPAANTAEGTPLYGMPILDAAAAKNLIICNYDESPGYAGVPNPIYGMQNSILLSGDATATLKALLEAII